MVILTNTITESKLFISQSVILVSWSQHSLQFSIYSQVRGWASEQISSYQLSACTAQGTHTHTSSQTSCIWTSQINHHSKSPSTPLNPGGYSDGWVDGLREDCQSIEPQDRARGTKQAPLLNPWRPYYTPLQRTDPHPCIYTCAHPAHSQTLAHTQTWQDSCGPRPFDIDLFFLSSPLIPHFFISRAASLVRLPVDTSQSDSPGLGSGAGLGGGLWGGVFGEMERRAGRKGGEEGAGRTITWQLTMECPALLPCVPACTQISSCQNQYASFPIFTHHVDRRLSP